MALFNRKQPKVVYGTEDEVKKEILNAILNFPKINFDTDDGRRIVSLVICSKILAQDIARIPIKLYKTDEEGNKTIIKDDPRNFALHYKPNSYLDSYTFKNSLEFTRASTGNSYARIIKDQLTGKVSFEIIPNDRIKGPVKVNNELYYYLSNDKNAEGDPINSSEILHFRNLSINGFKGRDPQDDLNINLGISFKALMTVDKFYENGGLPSVILESTVPEGINPQEWQDKMKDFNEKYSAYTNAFKVWSLAPFTKATTLPVNLLDAQFIETMKYNNSQVSCYYGIPPHKLGLIENSKFNSLQELQLDYTNNTIAPILEMYRREFEFKLLTDEEIIDGYSIEFETNALLITDSKTRMENYKNLFGLGAITPNQISRLENFESYEGGDQHYIATGYMGIAKANAINKDVSAN